MESVNQPQSIAEMMAVFNPIKHNRPYGSEPWIAKVEKRLGIGPLRKRQAEERERERRIIGRVPFVPSR